jgi:hypothetical protein
VVKIYTICQQRGLETPDGKMKKVDSLQFTGAVGRKTGNWALEVDSDLIYDFIIYHLQNHWRSLMVNCK